PKIGNVSLVRAHAILARKLRRRHRMEGHGGAGRSVETMITGAHSIIYSQDAEADRAFLRDVLNFPHVDVGHGWLIFQLPPGELAVHPADKGNTQALYLMCDDIEAFVGRMAQAGRVCGPVQMLSWGAVTMLTLPSGAQLGVYQPRHKLP